ncbi:MAG: glycyl-radical enzyme activating protein [Spirochaetota bacterium]|nr:MAG: glycyl-radical enzyme activating protein [Spirochaetota bacterium]
MSSGIVFNIQRFSIHDGPGIRTTVFLKGCPLHCAWCHNPESISLEPEISFNAELCERCGRCTAVCQKGAHVIEGTDHYLIRELCVQCGRCIDECMPEALQLIGEEMSTEEVITEVERDLPFYETSGGGMTISGGEPLYQFDFCLTLLKEAKTRDIHTCLDTSGCAPNSHFKAMLECVDLFLFDFKGWDPVFHKKYTGANPASLLKNLELLIQSGAKVILRCPIIPGYTDSDRHFKAIAGLEKQYPSILGIDILGFHELGRGKYDRLGKQSLIQGLKSVSEDQKNIWLEKLKSMGCSKAKVG